MLFKNNKLNDFTKQITNTNIINQVHQSELVFGNAFKLLKAIPDKSIDCIHTDIPYLLQQHSNLKAYNKRTHHYTNIVHNAVHIAKFSKGIPLHLLLTECLRVEKIPNLSIWCSQSQIYPIQTFFHNLHRKDLMIRIIDWHKTNPIAININRFDKDNEHCVVVYTKGHHLIHGNFNTKHMTYSTPCNRDNKIFHINHPTIKPLFIERNILASTTKPEDVVLDPFMGSATTGVACKMLNRKFIGFENNPKYYNIANQRMKQSNTQAQQMINSEISRIKDISFRKSAIKADKYIRDACSDNNSCDCWHKSTKKNEDAVLRQRKYVLKYYIKKNRNNPRSKYYRSVRCATK